MGGIEFNREALYEEVWNEPVTTVAKRYGISGHKLRKYCIQLQVPIPHSGYWMQIKYGKKVERPALLEYEGPDSVVMELPDNPQKKNISLFPEKLRNKTAMEFEVFCSELVVPEKLQKAHSVIADTITYKKKRDKEALSESIRKNAMFLKTSKEQYLRAIIIMNTLMKASEQWNGVIKSNGSDGFRVCIGKDEVSVTIKERTKRIEHVKTEQELKAESKGKYYWAPTYDYPYSGELRITIKSTFSSEKMWSDTPKRKIESKVGEILLSIFVAAENLRIKREEREVELEKRRLTEIERMNFESLKRAETEKLEQLYEKANDHYKAKRIIEFAQDLINCSEHLTDTPEDKEKLISYAKWALQKANWLDPLTINVDPLLGDKHRKWLNDILGIRNKEWWQ